jgi:hypothetical protein
MARNGVKTGGRVKGTPNKVTSTLREKISLFLDRKWGVIEQDFESLEPKDRIALFEKLLQYSIPKLQAVTETQEQETKPINVNITLTNETAPEAD